MMDVRIFDGLRVIVRKWIAREDLDSLKIEDPELQAAYWLFCRVVDDAPEWNGIEGEKEHRAFMKRAALVMFSKIGSDTAYTPVVRRYLRELRKEKLFGGA